MAKRFRCIGSSIGSAEQRDAKHVSFVYETQSPHLRLTWEWSAPAATGPLEHRIRIENLDTRALWLPLQTSFRYNWSCACGAAAQADLHRQGRGQAIRHRHA